ncbi:MAG: hypothetical protein IJP64_05160 [Oscillospiraceae bacterium]|nr:hypothetical protein [Oscillospiraceae bacterium]
MSAPRVSIFDPTGNVTALVEDEIEISAQSAFAAAVMERFPEVEQVGFVRLPANGERIALRMAGGEFCGNAAMSAAALLLLRRGLESDDRQRVMIDFSGVGEAVEVRLRREEKNLFRSSVRMPPAREITEMSVSVGGVEETLPLVRMQGISHVLVTPASRFFAMREDRTAAEETARGLCQALGADALGLMFLEGEAPRCRLTPLVFVPGSGTVFWERSCASGSAAAAMALSACRGEPVRLEFSEPGGTLSAESDVSRGETWLFGTTRLIEENG